MLGSRFWHWQEEIQTAEEIRIYQLLHLLLIFCIYYLPGKGKKGLGGVFLKNSSLYRSFIVKINT